MQTTAEWLHEQSQITLERLLPRILPRVPKPLQAAFGQRLRTHFPTAFDLLYQLYGQHYDFFYHLEQILLAIARSFAERPKDLHALDQRRLDQPDWFQSEQMLGGVCYVDLFAGTLSGIRERIAYFDELGLTYLHLMPLFKCPEKNNDGGYAVSSFREVNPALGTMEELAELARELRSHGISLVLDFVFNHTSDEHDWAKRALAGDKRYQQFYRMFDDRSLPDLYEPHLREIFPDQAPGSFTYRPEIGKWVWTTFYSFQWDLNYANPDLFCAMLGEMLFLANQGVEILRLDAVPFIWKELGTNCENLPQAHTIIRAYNALTRIACPALLFKSEAIVHPRDVRSYISPVECPLSYNPIMMVSLWEAAATREVRFFTHTMQKQFALPEGCAWVNYLRSHDDIGWGFADEDAAEMGINGYEHRHFLNLFYTGAFPGSFARGLPFNYNPRTGDMRISGTAASLAGIEQALELGNELFLKRAIQRLVMMYSIVLSAGGIPLIYLGDEIGTLNDYGYRNDPVKQEDSRWVHRPFARVEYYERRHDPDTIEGSIFQALRRLIAIRKRTPALRNGQTAFLNSGNPHVLAFMRQNTILVLACFSDHPETVSVEHLRGAYTAADDLISGVTIDLTRPITMQPYTFYWLALRD